MSTEYQSDVKKSIVIEVDGLKPIIIEGGHISRQSDGAVFLRCGGTLLHASVVSSLVPSANTDFIPLTVEYRERFSAAGKIPGGFFKREMQFNDTEVLISRLVDRALRPLFPENYYFDTQVIITLFSYDESVPPDTMACIAASSVLAMSDIPFYGPVACVRIAKINDEWIINPPKSKFKEAKLNVVVGGTQSSIVMVEGECKECTDDEFVEALQIAHEVIKRICVKIEEFGQLFEKSRTKREIPQVVLPDTIKSECEKMVFEETLKLCSEEIKNKKIRRARLEGIAQQCLTYIKEKFQSEWQSDYEKEIKKVIKKQQREAMRHYVFTTGRRIDGRLPDEIRTLGASVGLLEGPHGSALFTRGETQVLSSIVLGSQAEDMQIIDEVTESGKKKYMLHYNFPPYSVGEIKPLRAPSRREIGHSYLALKGLRAVLPDEDEYPFVIRMIADVLESNGSSSMATVCATSMALMDCGVPVKKHVAGIAMGLLMDEKTGRYVVLTDILGDEDHLGDMDFKLCGTRDGITACQMDIKLKEIKFDVLKDAIKQARKAHHYILNFMEEHIREPRKSPKAHAPKIETVRIPKDMIGLVIGTGGRTIRAIAEMSGTSICIVPKNDHGIVEIVGTSEENIKQAKEIIEKLVGEVKLGGIYIGQVKTIAPYGAFIEIAPGKVGLLHISEIDHGYVKSITDYFKEGDYVEVKVIEIDDKTGRFKLSRKALIPPKTEQTTTQ